MGHCFAERNLTQTDCAQFFDKMFSELNCMLDVKKMHNINNQEGEDVSYKCNCPPPCRSLEYETYYSTSKFPGNSLELDSAYEKIVLEKMVPYYKSINSSYANQMVDYFSNASNRESIMQNFARLTIYIKDLTVLVSKQVPAYQDVDLLSDIGR